ncbi:aminotransferase class I/II-fold pyridoxal phosphate-dependent enzyme [Variovorax saccharolyticus]|uniref:aminotransferase class I/II-fold pyridoxal phosphate-dependent enzyme n=1 Tax=Variovorax saccharolyticus TaxID=3053516 RepID=UPI002578ECDC|nr:aminotransferase class I/II-fold pyridoxal phosphate-dependent enzyme [Variovorax sp. J31P216]MDM0030186.1 aminotransferase class I/II-fold pyridoxal phosphate-dependent enzyme [Variovorax sp. J31P216]
MNPTSALFAEPPMMGELRASGALTGTTAQFDTPRGSGLLERTSSFNDWREARTRHGMWQYARSLEGAPLPIASVCAENGDKVRGINFASQDYLSLSMHPGVMEAAMRALRDYGPHSAGSPVLLGNTRMSLALEQAISELLQMDHVVLFPTGWGAAFGALAALVRRDDHVVIDALAHMSLRQGATVATENVVTVKHLNLESLRDALSRIRHQDTANAILVVTEGLFSMDSDSPDLTASQALCNEYNATLLVDVAHDLGAMGPGGTGAIGTQSMLGRVDLVMGSFSKSFASNGGFLATHSMAVKQFVKMFGGTHMFSNALSPVQAAVVLEACSVIASREGDELRESLMRNVGALRGELACEGLRCLGDPSPLVPVLIGPEDVSRLAGRLLFDRSVLVNQVEFPAVPIQASRMRMQVMADHTERQARHAARKLRKAVDDAQSMLQSAPAACPL